MVLIVFRFRAPCHRAVAVQKLYLLQTMYFPTKTCNSINNLPRCHFRGMRFTTSSMRSMCVQNVDEGRVWRLLETMSAHQLKHLKQVFICNPRSCNYSGCRGRSIDMLCAVCLCTCIDSQYYSKQKRSASTIVMSRAIWRYTRTV